LKASMNIVNDAQKERIVETKLVVFGQQKAAEFAFDNRDRAFDFGTFSIKDSWEVSLNPPPQRMTDLTGRPVAKADGIFGLQIRKDITMIGHRIETTVQGQTPDTKPRRFFSGDRFQFPGISGGTPTDVLAENQQGLFFDQKNMFDKPAMRLFPFSFQGVAQIPTAFRIMRTRIGQAISRTVAQSIASAFQASLQILQKTGKNLFEDLSAQSLVKLLKGRVIGRVHQAQKLSKPWVAQNLLFGLAIGPFVAPFQKQQSQKLTLPIYLFRKLTRIVFNDFLAKLKAYQNKLLVARQLFHESSSFSQRSLSGGAFRLFQATN